MAARFPMFGICLIISVHVLRAPVAPCRPGLLLAVCLVVLMHWTGQLMSRQWQPTQCCRRLPERAWSAWSRWGRGFFVRRVLEGGAASALQDMQP